MTAERDQAGPELLELDAIALVTAWIAIIASYHANWPLGFYADVIAAGFFLAGSSWTAVRRRWPVRQPTPALAPVI